MMTMMTMMRVADFFFFCLSFGPVIARFHI
jgi:hypothetical protein